ncbi:MAG: SDR family oxidoreductase [Patescibacteria group bacterium]|nr:SDR family oxidoreductase [Patescibacteria group bacterium]
MDLKEKVIVITGGSRGFGKALAELCIASGAHVVISGHDATALQNTAKKLSCDSFVANATSINETREFAKYVFEKYHTIDIWINNAGVQIAPSLVEDIDIEKMHHLFAVNFFGYVYGCQVALSYMKEKGKGVIININSTAGLEGKPGIAAYSSSKFAVRSLTESIRKELKNSNIQVYGVFPGGMQTEIYKEEYPADFREYMEVMPVAKKVIENLQSDSPEMDLVLKRPNA